MHIIPALSKFLAKYPKISIDFNLSDTVVDLISGGFDIAIRNSPLKDSTLVARKLAKDERIICASPDYLAKNNLPKTPQDLKNHQIVALSGLENWYFTNNEHVKDQGRLKVDNGEAMRDASINGLGISINSKWSVYKNLADGSLVEIMQNYPLVKNSDIWLVYPNAKFVTPKVKVFIDYFIEHFSNPIWQR